MRGSTSPVISCSSRLVELGLSGLFAGDPRRFFGGLFGLGFEALNLRFDDRVEVLDLHQGLLCGGQSSQCLCRVGDHFG